ncbi:MAG: thioredoxin family protein [Patescibacteria group bacterium]|nr:thioredoxin family protein [Patescibacteria group bacterium]
MKKKIFILFIFLFLLTGFFTSIKASQNDNNEVELYFFWGDGCTYCEQAKSFIKELKQEFPNLKVMSYEVNKNEDNYKFFRAMSQAYNIEEGIPLFLTENNFLAGYNKSSDDYLRKIVKDCVNSNCDSPLLKLKQANSNDIIFENENRQEQENNNKALLLFIIIFIIIGFVFIFFKKKK